VSTFFVSTLCDTTFFDTILRIAAKRGGSAFSKFVKTIPLPMRNNFVESLRSGLGLSSMQLAELLQVPYSQLSMAAGGFRQLPQRLQPWMNLLGEIAITAPEKNKMPLAKENPGYQQQANFANRQIRLLLLEKEKLELQLQRAEATLQQAERRCGWLPQLLQSPLCQQDKDKALIAQLLLRQSHELQQRCWQKVTFLQGRRLALQAAIAYWEILILDFH